MTRRPPSAGYDFAAKAATLQTLEECDGWDEGIRIYPSPEWDEERRVAVWERRRELILAKGRSRKK